MIANLYIHNSTLTYNGVDTEEEIKSRFLTFFNDLIQIINEGADENNIFVSYDICDCIIYKNKTLIPFAEEFLENELKTFFYTIIANTSTECDLTIDELYDKCRYNEDEKEINSLIIFNQESTKIDRTKYIQFDSYSIIYNYQNWIFLRRQILGNHPENIDSFMKNCALCFDKIIFSDNCKDSILKGYNFLKIIPQKIVYYLSCLNDGFFSVVKEHRENGNTDGNSILQDFSGIYSLDEPGSLEMRPNKKENFNFEFKIDKNIVDIINCEPHLKISQPDKGCTINIDFKTFHPRIYFNYEYSSDRIYIGSIGPHL